MCFPNCRMLADAFSFADTNRSRFTGRIDLLSRVEWLTVPLAIFFATRLAVFLVAFAGRILIPGNPDRGVGMVPLPESVAALLPDRWVLSLAIAEYGYRYLAFSGQAFPSVSPLYPLLVSTLARVFGDAAVAAIVVSNGAFLAALVLLYWLGRRALGLPHARTGLLLLALTPWSFLWSSAYPYSLALLLTVSCFVALEKGRHYLSVLFASLAALTVPFLWVLLLSLALGSTGGWDSQPFSGNRYVRLASIWVVPAVALTVTSFALLGEGFTWFEAVGLLMGLSNRPTLATMAKHFAGDAVVVWLSVILVGILVVISLTQTRLIARVLGLPYAAYVVSVLIAAVVGSPEEIGAAIGLAFPVFFAIARSLGQGLSTDLAVVVLAISVGVFTPLFSTAWLVDGTVTSSRGESHIETLVAINRAQGRFSDDGLDLVAGDDLLVHVHALSAGVYATGDQMDIPVSIHVLRSTAKAYVVSAHLLDRTGQRIRFADKALFQPGEPPSLTSGDHIDVTIPLALGGNVTTGEYAVALSVAELSFESNSYADLEVRSLSGETMHPVILGSTLVLDSANAVEESHAAPQHRLRASLGEAIELIGYDVAELTSPDAKGLEVTLYWRALSKPADDYTVFVQMLDGEGNLVAQSDGYPMNGNLPTSRFLPGIVFRDTHLVTVEAREGGTQHRLITGMYDLATMQRLPAQQDGRQVILDYVDLGEVWVGGG